MAPSYLFIDDMVDDWRNRKRRYSTVEADEVLKKVDSRLEELEYAASYFNKAVAGEVFEIRKIIRRYFKDGS